MKDHNKANGLDSGKRVLRTCKGAISTVECHTPIETIQQVSGKQAAWHPIHNLVVGRYPDEKFPSCQEGEKRTIDIIDGSSGEIVCQLLDTIVWLGIVSLNEFIPLGDSLASGMGANILIWTDAVKLEQIRCEKLKKTYPENGQDTGKDLSSQRKQRQRHRDDDDDIGAIKQRL